MKEGREAGWKEERRRRGGGEEGRKFGKEMRCIQINALKEIKQ